MNKNLNTISMNNSHNVCNQCGKIFSSSSHLNRHTKSVHEGNKYPCDECNFAAARADTLREHIQVIHERVKNFHCDQCDYSATRKAALNRHISHKHVYDA